MDPSEAAMEDAFQVLGLLKKDYASPANTATLDALGTRQLAYTVAGILDSMSASDVLEIGGDMVPWMSVSRLHVFFAWRDSTHSFQSGLGLLLSQEGLLQDRLLSAKKKRDKAQETSVSFEATGLMWFFCV